MYRRRHGAVRHYRASLRRAKITSYKVKDNAMDSSFSSTYAEARQDFLSLVSERNAKLVSEIHPTARGAQGEYLAMDLATFGDPDAEKTLILVSGTHGK